MHIAALHASLDAIGTDQRLVWIIAGAAIALLTATWWLLRQRSRKGRRAAAVCVTLSVVLHLLLFWAVPLVRRTADGNAAAGEGPAAIVADVTFSDFENEPLADSSADGADAPSRVPLPLPSVVVGEAAVAAASPPIPEPADTMPPLPDSLSDAATDTSTTSTADFDEQALGAMLSELLLSAMPATNGALDDRSTAADNEPTGEPARTAAAGPSAASASPPDATQQTAATTRVSARPKPARVVAGAEDDFAHRSGGAKAGALIATGGDATTEAAVAAGLRWLVQFQRSDGSWDPVASGAGQERSPLGLTRAGAGRRATMGLSGLALLALLGAGNTHRQGEYASEVHAGLSYLIHNQAPDGSLAGSAGTYDRTYCHGMAALALCETAAMTGDPAAFAAAEAAIAYSSRLQHPTTGGWRYTAGDPGDLSQLGWQAMALNSGRQAGIAIPPQTIAGAFRFLRSVRAGSAGGLACYRPGEAPTRTMTAEAMAARLLLRESLPQAEIDEAESYLLAEPPGVGQDNYYYWYYASLALHQLQDAAWQRWNERMKGRLIARQLPDGSWPTDSVWGGYGGSVYTTAMGCLCLEVYYRHVRQSTRVVAAPPPATLQR